MSKVRNNSLVRCSLARCRQPLPTGSPTARGPERLLEQLRMRPAKQVAGARVVLAHNIDGMARCRP
jgi:hypothetical protein